MAQSSHHSPRTPAPPRCLSWTSHLEAPWTQQSSLLKVKPKPSPFLKNNCCSHCLTHRHLECSRRKVKISPCRKFQEGSQCPVAQPLLRPKKTKAMQASRHLSSKWTQHPRTGSRILRRRQQEWAGVQAFRAGSGQKSLSICTLRKSSAFWATFWSRSNHESFRLEWDCGGISYLLTLPNLLLSQFFGNWRCPPLATAVPGGQVKQQCANTHGKLVLCE